MLPGDRIKALTYALSGSSIEIEGNTLTLGSHQLFLTDQAVAAIREVFPGRPGEHRGSVRRWRRHRRVHSG